MKTNSLLYCTALAIAAMFSACKKDNINGAFENTGNFTDTTGSLKSVATFPLGFAIEYPRASANNGNNIYFNRTKNDAAWITFGNELKNDAIVSANGTYNFTTADNFYNLATSAGLQVFGHTLVWHSQQRGAYYYSLIGGAGGGPAPTNLLPNGNFETAAAGSPIPFASWNQFNLQAGSSWAAATGGDIRTGTGALKVTVGQDNSGGEWRVQAGSGLFTTQVDKNYKVSYYVKAAAAGTAAIRLSTQNSAGGNANYQGNQNVSTSWTLVEWTFTAKDTQTRILLDLGAKANTYFFDDMTVTDASITPPPSNTQIAATVDAEMKKHIETVLNKYKGKIKAWDVINEPFTDGGGALRTLANSGMLASGQPDLSKFVWQEYLGRGYAAKAFQYAKAVDPSLDLYMNDYNLESNSAKLDAFITMAKELKDGNTGITGVGTQMHMFVDDPWSGIITMMQKLANTGLKVRISELDIRINPGRNNPTANYTPSEIDLRNQAAMYKFVIDTYLKYVPAAQRGGITIWGVDDATSWFNTSTNIAANKLDFALLYDKNFAKKPAYSAVKQALQGNPQN